MKSTRVSAKVNTNLVDHAPKDQRKYFLSVQNQRLLMAVTRFATDYVRGILRINNLVEMKCIDLKVDDVVHPTMCDGGCKKKFARNTAKFLYCVVDKSSDEDKEFKFVCKDCSQTFIFRDQYKVIQLYPFVSLDDVHQLCEVGFLTKYIFPIKLEYTEKTHEFEKTSYHDFFKVVRSIVSTKKPFEQITQIKLRTYGRTLFTETDNDCIMKSGLGLNGDMTFELEFYPRDSSMMTFLDVYKDTKPLTYFYSYTKRVYTSRFDYVVYFPIKCDRFCKLCRADKMYLNVHPVLYCSQCGYTDPKFFQHSQSLSSIVYFHECVKMKTQKPRRIYYYDMSTYKTLIKKLK